MRLVAVEDGAVLIALPSGRQARLSLQNLQRLLADLPAAAHPAAIARFAAQAQAALQPAAARRLLPRLSAPGDARDPASPWFAPLADGALWLTIVADEGGAFRYVRPLDFPRWGLAVAAAKAEAMDNLRADSAETAPQREGAGVLRLTTGDGLDASRLLIAEQWVSGPLLAVAPSRDALWMIPLTGAAAVPRALAVWEAASARRMPYPLTRRLLLRVDGALSALRVVSGRLQPTPALVEALAISRP